jgi:hypothetical protein
MAVLVLLLNADHQVASCAGAYQDDGLAFPLVSGVGQPPGWRSGIEQLVQGVGRSVHAGSFRSSAAANYLMYG